jgi:CRISPR-associated protein Cas1
VFSAQENQLSQLMQTLYVSEQNCYVCIQQESLIVKQGETLYGEVQLPLLEQILIFGYSQVTTQAIRACLSRDIPIGYLSRMGYCYGRILPISRGYRQLSRYQQQLSPVDKLITARAICWRVMDSVYSILYLSVS